jgi:hypothetical protein
MATVINSNNKRDREEGADPDPGPVAKAPRVGRDPPAPRDATDFVLEKLTAYMEPNNLKLQPRTVIYALHELSMSHPDFNDGQPFVTRRSDLASWLGGYCGGGKMMFKILASCEEHRLGQSNKKTRDIFKAAGLACEWPLNKKKV